MGCLPMMSAVLLRRARVYGPEQLRGLRFARLARGVLLIAALWMRARAMGSEVVWVSAGEVYRGSARVAALPREAGVAHAVAAAGSRVMVGTDGGLFELNGKGSSLARVPLPGLLAQCSR